MFTTSDFNFFFFLHRLEYKVFQDEILHAYRIHHYLHLAFFRFFFKTLNCVFQKNQKYSSVYTKQNVSNQRETSTENDQHALEKTKTVRNKNRRLVGLQ
jgi:hypothetical protein